MLATLGPTGGFATSANIFALAITLGELEEFSSAGGTEGGPESFLEVGVGRGFLGEGMGGSVGGGALLGLGAIGGGFATVFGATAGLLSLVILLASCCCLSLCFNHAGLLSSPPSPLVTATGGFEGAGTVGGDSEEGSGSSFFLSACICFLFRKNSGSLSSGSGSSFCWRACICFLFRTNSGSSSLGSSIGGFRLTHEGGEPVSLFPSPTGDGTFAVFLNWLAQGAMCADSSSFLSLFSNSSKAELLPCRLRASFIISDMSIPPPPPVFGLAGGLAGFPVFIVAAFTWPGLVGLRSFTGIVPALEVREVATERVGSGGPACFCGLAMEGMGVVGRGGGEEGMLSLYAASGRSS